MSARVSAVVGALCFACLSLVLTPQAAVAQQGSKDRTVNPKMGPPLQAAITAANNKQYDVALAKMKEADAEKKTSYEQFKIHETLAFIYSGQKKYAETAGAYEKMLETPQFLKPEQVQTFPKSIAQMYAGAQQYPKVIDYGKRWLTDHPGDTEMLALVGSAYYSTKDNKGCLQSFQSAVLAAEKAGAKPQEPWLRFTQTCASLVGDDASEGQAYEKLIRYYPKPEYWQIYLRKVSRNDPANVARFNWLRLMSDTDSFKNAEDYMTFAQQGIAEYGVACEAMRSLEEGFSKKVLGVDEKSKVRHQNTLAKAKEVAAADKARVQQLVAEAESDATGQKYVDVGMIQFGCQQYDQAIANLDKGIKKGGGKDPANAKLVLGIAQLKKGERDSARNTFKALSNDKVLGKIASTWTIRSYN
jgi:tetratricopeptide (TPR) repeat protein